MPHGRHQHNHHTPVDPAPQKTNRGRRMPLAAPIPVATKTIALNGVRIRFRPPTGFARVIGSMQLAPALLATALATFLRQFSIASFQKPV
jgi:hypothetical protein